MNNNFKKAVVVLSLLITSVSLFAQQASPPVEMADSLYQSGKIYVLVVVAAIIFLGIAGYLTMLDRKISKLEKEIKKK